MAEPIVVVGAGGFGRETIDVIEAINAAAESPLWDLLGVVDDAPSDLNLTRLKAMGVPYLGAIERLPGLGEVAVVIGIGSPVARQRVAAKVEGWGLQSPDLVHPTAVIGSEVGWGGGAVVCALVSIGTNVELGCHVHLNPHAVVGHDTVLGDWVSVNPNATVSGDCVVEEKVLVGAGAVILHQVRVGRSVVVGAAACVVADAPDEAVLKGVPAR